MNLSFVQSLSTSAFCFFREKAEIVLTPQQKKIIAIASLALGCLAALYLMYLCCCFEAEVKTGEEDDDFFSLDRAAIKGEEVTKELFKDGTVVEGFLCHDGYFFKGKKTYFDGKIEEGIFRGKLPDDHLNGKGIITFPDGSVSKGDFLNGKLNGKGKIIHHNGIIQEGEFHNDKLDGKGTVTIPGGDTITGFFENDKLNGYGKVVHPDGSMDEGLFENHVLVKRKSKSTDATSEFTEKMRQKEEEDDDLSYYYYHPIHHPPPSAWDNFFKRREMQKIELKHGAVIEGFYTREDEFIGKKTYVDGKIEIGEFDKPEGRLWGRGKMTFPDGSVWKGIFTYGYLSEGKKIHANETIEEGTFKKNKLHGKGTITIPGGDTITGFFEKDKLNGYGKVIHPDGSIDEGLFENNVLVKRKPKPTYSTATISEKKREEATTSSSVKEEKVGEIDISSDKKEA